jgi:type IV pilus assembly protein PilE
MVVALAILAVLTAMVLPSFQRQLMQAQRLTGHMELWEVMARQERYFADHKHYASDLTDLGFPGDPYGISAGGNRTAPESAGAIYEIGLEFGKDEVWARARPAGTQAGDALCGVLGLSSSGMRAASGVAGIRGCW